MSVRQQLRSLWITAVLVIVGVIGIVVFDAERQRGAQQEIASLTSSRMADLERLKATLGYGGLIHDLKNFLIRGDLRYAEGFADSLADARYAIERLRAHHVVGSEEWGALEQIERTAEQYAEAMRYASEHRPAYAAGGDASWIERLDAEIRVDDTPAMSALSMLRASYVANIERAEDGERATRASFLLSASVVALLGSLLYLLFYFKLTRGLVNPVLKVGPGSQLDASMAARVLRETPGAMLLLSEDGQALFASKRWEEQFGPGTTGLGSHEPSGIEGEWVDALVRLLKEEPDFDRGRKKLVASCGQERWVVINRHRWMDPVNDTPVQLVLVEPIDELVGLERDLSSVQDRLRFAVGCTNDGLWDWPDVESDEEWWSPQYYRLLGYEPGEIPSTIEQFTELMHPDDRDKVFRAVEQAMENRGKVDLTYRLKLKSGQYRWFRGRAAVHFDEAGNVIRMGGSIQDDHDRVFALECLEQSRRELRVILDAIQTPVTYVHSDGSILNCNEAACEAIGQSRDDIIGYNLISLYDRQHYKMLSSSIREALDDGSPVLGLETTSTNASGEPQILMTNVFPVANADGECDRVVAVAIDVTRLREAERAARLAGDRLELSMRGANLAAWDWDVAAETVKFSETWYTMLGFEPGELPMTPETWEKLIFPVDLEPTKAAAAAHLNGESELYEADHRMRQRDGSLKWIRTVGRVMERDDSGAPVRVSGMHIDIDRSKRLQQELAERNEELGRFLYTASHDLKSPIVTMAGYTSHLKADLAAGRLDELEHYSDRISNATNRMKSIIDSLLEVSRVGLVELPPETLDPEEVIGSVLADHSVQLDEAGIRVIVEPTDRSVCMARTHLLQVLDNLVTNAIRYGRSDAEGSGESVLRIAIEEDAQGEIVLCVDDSGPGVAPEHCERIFGLFERLGSNKDSTGVGLAIIARIAQLYECRAWVIPTPGEGAKFRVSLPGESSRVNQAEHGLEAMS